MVDLARKEADAGESDIDWGSGWGERVRGLYPSEREGEDPGVATGRFGEVGDDDEGVVTGATRDS